MFCRPAILGGIILLAGAAGCDALYKLEERLGRSAPPIQPRFALAVRIEVLSPSQYEVTRALLEPVVHGVIRQRAPWITLDSTAPNRLDLRVELEPMPDNPKGYRGWVRASFYRARRLPAPFNRPPDWSDKILVFGVPPELGSLPKDNVRGAVRIISENFLAGALEPR